MNTETFEAKVMTCFPVFFEYNSQDHLSDNEIALADNFYNEYLKLGKHICINYSDESNFGYCDVLGQHGDVIDVTITVFK